jgi:hypothetical protein
MEPGNTRLGNSRKYLALLSASGVAYLVIPDLPQCVIPALNASALPVRRRYLVGRIPP